MYNKFAFIKIRERENSTAWSAFKTKTAPNIKRMSVAKTNLFVSPKEKEDKSGEGNETVARYLFIK